jgi:hypothetical protein
VPHSTRAPRRPARAGKPRRGRRDEGRVRRQPRVFLVRRRGGARAADVHKAGGRRRAGARAGPGGAPPHPRHQHWPACVQSQQARLPGNGIVRWARKSIHTQPGMPEDLPVPQLNEGANRCSVHPRVCFI